MGKDWENLDTEKLLRRQREQHEQTTSGGVGGYEVPLGAPLRPPAQTVEPPKKKRPKKK